MGEEQLGRVVVVVVVVVNERAKPDHPHTRLVVGVGVWMEGEAGGTPQMLDG